MQHFRVLPIALLLLALLAPPALAQSGPGAWFLADCATLANPVTGQSWCYHIVPPYALFVWDGSTWQPVSGPGYRATCPATLTIGLGNQTCTTQTGLAYQVGTNVRFTSITGGQYMEGYLIQYAPATGVMTITVDHVNGSGTYTGWNISVTGDVGATTLNPCFKIGKDNGPILVNADLGPQTNLYQFRQNSTLQEISVSADTGTPSVQVRKRHCDSFTGGICTAFTLTNLLTTPLSAPAQPNALACARSAVSQPCINGTTSAPSVALSNTFMAAGDFLELASGTAGGAAHTVTVCAHATVP